MEYGSIRQTNTFISMELHPFEFLKNFPATKQTFLQNYLIRGNVACVESLCRGMKFLVVLDYVEILTKDNTASPESPLTPTPHLIQ